METEEFTDAQLTAYKRRVDAGGNPACDYGVLGPCGFRIERAMKFQAVFKEPTGQERTVEVAGPNTLDVWEGCHQVFKSLALACKTARISTLDNYKAKFKERALEYPGQWGLAMAADVICRTELWPRLKSQHKRMYDDPNTRAMSPYDPTMPWDSAIAASTTDDGFWGKYLERKALKSIATGSRGSPVHAVENAPTRPWAPAGGTQGGEPAQRRIKISGRDGAWNGVGNEKRPDGRYYLDTDFKKF